MGGAAGNYIPNTSTFTNEQIFNGYWLGSGYITDTRQVEKVVVVSGDTHKNVPPISDRKIKPLYEVTSSGAAEPGPLGGGNSGNFGLLTLGDDNKAELFSANGTDGKSYPLIW